MKVETSSLALQSAHRETQARAVSERLRMWVGARPDFEAAEQGRPAPARLAAPVVVRISDAARAKASQDANAGAPAPDELPADPQLRLLVDIIERLTGQKVRLVRAQDLRATVATPDLADPNSPSQPPRAGHGVEYDYRASYTETESTRFTAEGLIRTADGQEIRFRLELAMQRRYHEETNVSLRLGDAVRAKDPLVINFAGTAAELADARFAFDLDADGRQEQVHPLARGSGFLALDRNHNGRIDDGRELFGPHSGDGFADLAAYDADGNGWIDANDPVFGQLRIWSRSADGGEQLHSLGDAGVGAISLARVATPFDLRSAANAQLGQVRTSGVYLTEDGQARTVQQVDLTV